MNAPSFVPDTDHPTPVHIWNCMAQRLREEERRRGEMIPKWAETALLAGMSRAFQEHDAARVRKGQPL